MAFIPRYSLLELKIIGWLILNTVCIKLSPPPPLFSKNCRKIAKVRRKQGGTYIVRDRRPRREFQRNTRKMQLIHEIWPNMAKNYVIKGGGVFHTKNPPILKTLPRFAIENRREKSFFWYLASICSKTRNKYRFFGTWIVFSAKVDLFLSQGWVWVRG